MSEMNRTITVMAALAGLLCIASHAAAQQAGHLNVSTVVEKEQVVVDENGEEQRRRVPAETVVPGEQVFYTITFQNIGGDPADNVVITNPIAADLTYVDGSAEGTDTEIRFSVDGGVTFAGADELVVYEDGVARPADAGDYTHIRWILRNDLRPGADGVARFAAVLN